MKKLISLCLSLVLALTLAAPALAAAVELPEDYLFDPEVQAWIDAHPEETAQFLAGGIDAYVQAELGHASVAELAEAWGESEAYLRDVLLEFWVQEAIETEAWNAWLAEYEAAHPGTREQLEANAYDYFAKEYSWYDSPEEYMEYWEMTEEAFIAQMVKEQFYGLQEQEERSAKRAAFEAAHPGVLAQLEANVYDYFAQEYTWYDSPEEFMEYRGLTEAEFIARMVDEQIDDILYQEAERERIDEAKAALGGVPGEIGVMLNDTYLTFPDAVPEAADGRVMVPYRPLMEALGGAVDYDGAAQTVTCTLGETALTLTLGETTLTITEKGETTQLEMDCAAYAKGGRTYVPVRFVSQAFGYTVLWDADYETAVVLDLDALAEEIDQNFTILNRALANWQLEPEQAYELKLDADLSITQFDTLHGDKTLPFSMQADCIWKGQSAQGTYQIDLSSLMRLLAETVPDDEAGLLSILGQKVTYEYILNAETGESWFRSPLQAEWAKQYAGISLSEDCWLHDSTDITFPAGLPAPLTVGSLLCANFVQSAQSPYYHYVYDGLISIRQDILSNAQETAAIIGDGCFTHTDQGDTFTYEPEGEDRSLTFTVDARGNVTGSFQYEENSTWGWSDPYRITAAFTLRSGALDLDLNYHQKNSCQIQLDLTVTLTQTGRTPLDAPPAGDPVVELDSLFDE